MIVNIRGTSGSGKTTLMRWFLEQCDSVEKILVKGKKKVQALKCIYKGELIHVLGSYDNLCGGCDTISTQDEVCRLIEEYDFEGHVLFEGLMISHIYERYASLARKDIDNWVFFMLETDFDMCIDHIRERRVKQERTTELKDSVFKNARRTYDATYRIRKKFENEEIAWVEIPMENRFKKFQEHLDIYLGAD